MTVYELLHGVSFDDIVPFVDKYDTDKCLASYKLLYDRLRQIPQGEAPFPGKDSYGNSVIISYGNSDSILYASAKLQASLNGNSWEDILYKEVIIKTEVSASLAEVATCCLLEGAFVVELNEVQKDLFGKEVAKAVKKYKDMFPGAIPTKKQMLIRPFFHREVNKFTKISVRDLGKKYPKQRRAEARKWISYLYNETIVYIGRFIENLLLRPTIGVAPTTREVCYLFQAEQCNIDSFQTVTNDVTRRGNYLRELMDKYHAFESGRLLNGIVSICSSSQYPITEEEVDLLQPIVTACGGEFLIYKQFDDTLNQTLKVEIAFWE